MTNEQTQVQRTLRYSILDGLGYSVMVGAGESYFIAYALFLGSSNLLLGFLLAVPVFVGSLSQMFSEWLLHFFKTRKRFICTAVFLQALTLVPVIGIHELPSARRGLLLLIFVCAYWACGLILGPSWSSLMGDLVSERQRGKYFGRRARYNQITTFLSLVAAGLILYLFKERGQEFAGYVLIFAWAALARLASFFFLLGHWDPGPESAPARRGLGAVTETFRRPHQRVLVLYLTLMNFGVYMALPFFSAYMLRRPDQHGLGWSYVTYTAANGIGVLFKFVFLPLWGRASDRFGARKCLVLVAWFLSSLPLFWLFPPNPRVLHLVVICCAQVLSGFAWAGQELCSFRFLLDSARGRDRRRLIASMNVVNGVMILLGSAAGAVIVSRAPSAVNPFLLVFLVASLARFAVSGSLVWRLHEARSVKNISYGALFLRVTRVGLLWQRAAAPKRT